MWPIGIYGTDGVSFNTAMKHIFPITLNQSEHVNECQCFKRTPIHGDILKFGKNIKTDLTITRCEYMDWILLARGDVGYMFGKF